VGEERRRMTSDGSHDAAQLPDKRRPRFWRIFSIPSPGPFFQRGSFSTATLLKNSLDRKVFICEYAIVEFSFPFD